MADFSPVVIARDDQRLVRQVDRTAAIGEAQRLARAHPGTAFAVYVPVVFFEAEQPPVREKKIVADVEIDIPF